MSCAVSAGFASIRFADVRACIRGSDGPVSGIQTFGNQSMQGRIWPCRRLCAVTVLDRVHVQIVHVPVKVRLVADLMFPEAALPDRGFAATGAARGLSFGQIKMTGASLRGQAFDQIPAQAVIGIVSRQGPEAVQVIGQQHPGVDGERVFGTDVLNGVS